MIKAIVQWVRKTVAYKEIEKSRKLGRLHLTWRLSVIVVGALLAALVGFATYMQSYDYAYDFIVYRVLGREKPSDQPTVIEVQRTVNVSPTGRLSAITPNVFWYTLYKYSQEKKAIYSKNDTSYEGSFVIDGAEGYDYYKNMRIVFGGFDKGEIVIWREPIASGFVNATSGSPTLDFSTNRLPENILLCIDHGPGPLVRSIMLYKVAVRDTDDSPYSVHEALEISDRQQIYTITRPAQPDCIDDLYSAVSEFGLSSDGYAVSPRPVIQYQADRQDATIKNYVYTSFEKKEGATLLFSLRMKLEDGVKCTSYGNYYISSGDTIDNIDRNLNPEAKYKYSGRCKTSTDNYGYSYADRYGTNDVILLRVTAGAGPFIATCSQTHDPRGGKTVIRNDWFRYDAHAGTVTPMDGPPPFKSTDSVFCHNTFNWKRPS